MYLCIYSKLLQPFQYFSVQSSHSILNLLSASLSGTPFNCYIFTILKKVTDYITLKIIKVEYYLVVVENLKPYMFYIVV